MAQRERGNLVAHQGADARTLRSKLSWQGAVKGEGRRRMKRCRQGVWEAKREGIGRKGGRGRGGNTKSGNDKVESKERVEIVQASDIRSSVTHYHVGIAFLPPSLPPSARVDVIRVCVRSSFQRPAI